MSVFLVILGVVLVANGLLLALLSRQFNAPAPVAPSAAQGQDQTQNYTPMLRMFNREDLEFLRRQPGFTRATESRFRRQRATLFLLYLKCLEGDFRQACVSLKSVIVQSSTDRSDLASVVLRHQLQFVLRMVVVRFHVVLYRWGIGKVDAAGILQPFDALREMMQSLSPAPQPIAG